jgi:alanine-glyoxylate transaminase/serine-glyoxylate transaminase/serine-pyruvate transaminase
VKQLLRFVFATANALTFPISGRAARAWRRAIVNLVEPGDEVVVGVNGVFGTRMADVIERAGATAVRSRRRGDASSRRAGRGGAAQLSQPKLVALVHAETSTGAWQPLRRGRGSRTSTGALFLSDCVTSLGGVPVEIDAGTSTRRTAARRSAFAVRPGLAPVTFGARALEVCAAEDEGAELVPRRRRCCSSTGARSASTITPRRSR